MLSKNDQRRLVQAARTIVIRDELLMDLTGKKFIDAYLSTFIWQNRACPEQAYTVYCETVKFLITVACRPSVTLTPSKLIGTMWLDLGRPENLFFYNRLLDAIQLPYVIPDGPVSPHKKTLDQYEQTVDTYQRLFGQPPTQIWPKNGPAPLETYVADDSRPD